MMQSTLFLLASLAVTVIHAFAPSQGLAKFHEITTSRRRHFFSSTVDTTHKILSTGEEPKKESEQFDWLKAWYPLVPVEILDPEIPHHFQLFGQDVVVWNDGPIEGGVFGPKSKRRRGAKRIKGKWRAFVDECPHRKVPLSEGRVEDDGSLMCSYHAWRYDGKGKCIAVPQVESQDELERIKSNPKSSCSAFPTKEINGVLYVWPNSDENSVLESELTPVNHHPDESDSRRLWEGPWSFRELPYGADFFLENVVDPAHATVSHHKTMGNRYDSQVMEIETTRPLTKEGFSQKVHSVNLPFVTNFVPPSCVSIVTKVGDNGAKSILELYVSPSRPGFCYHVGRQLVLKDEYGKMPNFLRRFTLPLPIWLNHVLTSSFYNQDALFLHRQERSMAETGKYKALLEKGEEPYHYNKAVFPVNSDKGVMNFRTWLRQFAGGQIPYKYGSNMSATSDEIVFDVWNAHTKHCKYCQDALKRLKKVRFASFFAATCLGVARPAKLGAIGNMASTLGFAGIGLLVNKLIGKFYRYECSHAHND